MPAVIPCPDPGCGAPAEIMARWTFGSTSGPLEHVQTRCERGHIFTPTVDSLTAPAVEPAILVGAATSPVPQS